MYYACVFRRHLGVSVELNAGQSLIKVAQLPKGRVVLWALGRAPTHDDMVEDLDPPS